MGEINLTFFLIMALNLNLISSIRGTIEQKKFSLILPGNFSIYRHELTNEMKIKPKKPQKIHYNMNYKYCVYFEIFKNKECSLNNNLIKREIYVLCEKPAINQFGNCNGDGFYGLNTNFINLQTNCLGVWKKLNRTYSCNADFFCLIFQLNIKSLLI
jgi:hypothetical protein